MNALLDSLRRDCAPHAVHDEGWCVRVAIAEGTLPAAGRLIADAGARLSGIIAEQHDSDYVLRYPFWFTDSRPWLMLETATGSDHTVPSLSPVIYAADWPEREIEDLFGLHFSEHPRLGNFVLHDEVWPEGVAPMRHEFESARILGGPSPYARQQVVHAEGSFTVPVGPVYTDIGESGQFLIETIGEEIIHVDTRLFYKYRAIEKRAEGKTPADALLLVERLNGTASFAHALAAAQAIERATGAPVPARAATLRCFWAEFERLRNHAATIAGLCKSTGLAVPTSLLYACVEDLLRLSAEASGHRYLFGLLRPGGLNAGLDDAAVVGVAERAGNIADRLMRIAGELFFDNGFLDRLEEVGVIATELAEHYDLVGPIGRASGRQGDLRIAQPYAGYDKFEINEAAANEGDNFARLRVFLDEAAESARLLPLLAAALPAGPVTSAIPVRAGVALAWAEAPAGASACFVRIDNEGRIARLRLMPPAAINWHVFHRAAEEFTFQDFPITLASFGLSMAEQDR
ncbi:MAG: NADH-quinone oxidoreductase subunit C [Rhodanobacteraceae bacterium]